MHRAWFAALASAVVVGLLVSGLGSVRPDAPLAGVSLSGGVAAVGPPAAPGAPSAAAEGPGAAVAGVSPELSGPGGIYSVRAWSGLDASAACTGTCVAPDPSLATDDNYVVELTETAYRIWTSNETVLANGSLDTLFDAGSDVLASPEVVYDSATLRWFVSALDVSADQVVFGASVTGDPTADWRVHYFAPPPAGDVLAAPRLAVDSGALVVTVETFHAGAFAGSEVLAANKSALVAGTSVATSVSGPDAFWGPLVPATPVAPSSFLYLASDGWGNSSLELLTVAGVPPSPNGISVVANLTSGLAPAPNATQEGSSALLAAGPATVQSAVWDGTDLWAAADAACVPGNDSAARACLHLWEVDTANASLVASFNWSSGAGTYDLYPALALDARQNLVVVFDESSATEFPSVAVTGRTGADVPGTLEAPTVLKAGGEPDRAPSCATGVCAFGNFSAAVLAPFHNRTFWVVGEYMRNNTVADPWHTWIDRLMSVDGFPVAIGEVGLPNGTAWTVTVNGANTTSNGSLVTVFESAGSYSFSVPALTDGPPGTEFVATPSTGTFTVGNSSLNLSVRFVQQFEVTGAASPSVAGTVAPEAAWFPAGSTVNLSAAPTEGWVFASWAGQGAGAYSGPTDPTSIEVVGPVREVAQFYALGEFPVTFQEVGLPVGSGWTVVVNGISVSGSNSSIAIDEPNGSYSFAATPYVAGPAGVRYSAAGSDGVLNVTGAATGLSISYLTQFALSVDTSPAGAGTVTPASGWYDLGSHPTLAALSGPSSEFAAWTGVGNGSYTGAADPANLTLVGPTTEVAEFVQAVVYPVVFDQSGLGPDTDWAVTVDGLGQNTTDGAITFYEPNGSYAYTSGILGTGGSVGPYSVTPPSGNFTVAGAPINRTLAFSIGSADTAPPATTSLWVPLGLSAAAVILGVALVTLLGALRRARRESRSLVIMTVPGAVPEPWDETPLAPAK